MSSAYLCWASSWRRSGAGMGKMIVRQLSDATRLPFPAARRRAHLKKASYMTSAQQMLADGNLTWWRWWHHQIERATACGLGVSAATAT